MYLFCLPFWSLFSISSPEQGGGEQESRKSCSVVHTLADMKGFTYLTKTCFLFQSIWESLFSCEIGGNITRCQ